MLREVYRFELRHHLHSPVFWMSAVLFFLLSFGAVSSDVVQIGGAIGNVNRNAPYVVMQILLVMSIIGIFVSTAFVAGAVIRDADYGTEALLFSTPVGKLDYLAGRFLGAFTAAALIYLPVVLGIVVGSAMPWIEPERLGPFQPMAYLYAMAVLVLPNLLLMSAFFFGLATLTRSMMGTYVGLVAFFVGYSLAGAFLSDLDNERLAALVDPFGAGAFGLATRYWTTIERNTRVVGLDAGLLTNRLLWLGVAGAVLALTYARFSFTARGERRGWRRGPPASGPASEPAPLPRAARARPTRSPAAATGRGAALVQLLHQARMETVGVFRSLPFLIILAFGILNLVGSSTVMDQLFGTPVWPETHLLLDLIDGSFLLIAVIILTFYSGELVWRERQEGLDTVFDAFPVPGWVYWGGKGVALALVVAAVLGVAMLTGMAIQAFKGYTDFDVPLYLRGLFLEVGIPFLLIAVLALFLQVVLNQKYVGFLAMVLYFVSAPILAALDLDHNLILYGDSPATPYSHLNGYGHVLRAALWFHLYWGFAALGLVALVHLFWVRGKESGLRQRIALARQRLGPGSYAALALALLGFVGTGSWIWYNTAVLNDYVPRDEARDQAARYETTYKALEGAPEPRIASVYSEVDIHPYRRAVELRGRYTLVNRTEVPIDSLHLQIDPDLEVRELTLPGAERIYQDEEVGWSTWRLGEPLLPGAELEMSFALDWVSRGFTNEPEDLSLVWNGTFFNNAQVFPHIGYTRTLELDDPNERRKRGLPPVQRMPPLEDSSAVGRNYLTAESDWVDFETVVSTSADQIALAPGYLQREWEQDGRRYFHYRMDAPILGFWSYLSGRWEVTRDRWNDVEIAVYHHPDHTYNVARMIDAVKKSLATFTREFGPYQHRQLRIVEFPRYASFAQSFPNTIPFSESIGFVARLEDPDDVDYVFYVTAHEVAHQWWAHQVIGAFQQGATITSETMSQYAALMVMEREYGPEKMRRFLEYELDRYLQGRGGERIEELPLLRVENQPYIHYNKGSLVMYALRDQVGEAALDAVLREYVADRRFTGPPYTTSEEFLSYVARAVPEERRGILEDLFRTITLYDLRTREASAEPTGDGRWRVRLALEARKLRATGQGEESEVALDDWVDVGVFGEVEEGSPPEGKVLYLRKHHLTPADTVIEVTVAEEPQKAGVDPLVKLIDRRPDDNLVDVTRGGSR